MTIQMKNLKQVRRNTTSNEKINLVKVSNDELIQSMEKLVRTERKITHLVLLHIIEIEDRKLHLEMGYDGMYTYLTRGLGYSEGSAYRRLQSARLLRQVPALAEKIENGRLNLTQLAQVQKSLKEAKKANTFLDVKTSAGSAKNQEGGLQDRALLKKAQDIFEKIENKNSFETQKTLALEMNLPVHAHERIKPQADSSVRLEVTLTAEQFQDLETAKNFLSHVCPDGNWAEVITTLAKQFNKRKLVGKSTQSGIAAEKIDIHQKKTHSQFRDKAEGQKSRYTREYISLSTKRLLLKKAQYCCEYQDPKTGKKCASKFHLQIDHIKPVAWGGF